MSICAGVEDLTSPPLGYNGDVTLIVSVVFIVAETFLVGLRFFARYRAGTPWGYEDVLVPVALFSNLALCSINLAMLTWGASGYHTLWVCMMKPAALEMYGKLEIPFSIFFTFTVGFGKLAILALFPRIFVKKSYRYTTYGLMAFQVAAMIAATVTTVTMCIPLAYLWAPQDHPGGHCINIAVWWRYGNIPQAVTDAIILVLPIPALWNLKISKKERIGLIATFCTGSVGLIVSVVRPIIFPQLEAGGDNWWAAAKIGSLSIAEGGSYLIAACLPTYRSLFVGSKRAVKNTYKPKGFYGTLDDKNPNSEAISMEKSKKTFGSYGKSTFNSTAKTTDRDSTDEELLAPGEIQVQKNFTVSSRNGENGHV